MCFLVCYTRNGDTFGTVLFLAKSRVLEQTADCFHSECRMSQLPSRAMQQSAETQCATGPLPLFRPEVLCKQGRFFGEVLLIRPFSCGFLGWLTCGAAALTFCVLFFGTYTEMVRVRGVLLRGPTLESLQYTSPEGKALVAVPYLRVAIEPGTHIAMRCLRCADSVAQLPAIAQRVSNLTAPAAKPGSNSARQILELSYEASAATSLKQLSAPGTAVELALPIGERRLFKLFEPCSVRGKSQP
jgi:hypothetical protein